MLWKKLRPITRSTQKRHTQHITSEFQCIQIIRVFEGAVATVGISRFGVVYLPIIPFISIKP